jgi:hypothetical protein
VVNSAEDAVLLAGVIGGGRAASASTMSGPEMTLVFATGAAVVELGGSNASTPLGCVALVTAVAPASSFSPPSPRLTAHDSDHQI